MPGSVALVVGGTGMAANGIVPCLLNDHGDEFDQVICLALQVDEKTFAGRTPKPYVPLSCNLNDKNAVVAALKKIGSPTHTSISLVKSRVRAQRRKKNAYRGIQLGRLHAIAAGVEIIVQNLQKKKL